MASRLMTALLVSAFFCLACDDSKAQEKSHEAAESTKHSSALAEPKLVVPIKREKLDVKLELPGELLAFRDVPIHAKVEGYISWIGVDRGSQVKKGDPMIKISCPELGEKLSESDAKKSSAESTLRETQSRYQSELERLVEAKTQLDADKLTASRLTEASKTEGAVAQNDVDQAQKKAEASASRVHAIESNVKAVAAVVEAQKNNLQATIKVKQSILAMQDYLTI
ncbi:MAG: efflux RND transporter periplasmic adaptor subunit, partial [Candidatus Obscuribacterales bacterium]|nr:efflux RND transporter periplasmic adaptor subunit [Candidatus Obscuribacterales bacterium]